MNSIQISDFNLNQETQTSDSGEVHFPVDGPKDLIMVDSTEPTFVSTQCELGSRLTAKSDELWSDAVMCDSRSRMIPSGLTRSNSIGQYFANIATVFVWFIGKENKLDLDLWIFIIIKSLILSCWRFRFFIVPELANCKM